MEIFFTLSIRMINLPAKIAKAKRRNIIELMFFFTVILNKNLPVFANTTSC